MRRRISGAMAPVRFLSRPPSDCRANPRTRRRRGRRAGAIAASASAMAGTILFLLLADPPGLWDDVGRAAAPTTTNARSGRRGTEESKRGLMTFRMYKMSGESGHRRTAESSGQVRNGGEVGARASHEGLHFVDLYVGNPAQRRTLAVMTGSDFTAFPCGDCLDCPSSLSQYQFVLSPTFSPVRCGKCLSPLPPEASESGELCSPDGAKCLASAKYADQSSWAGYEARDAALIGAPRSAEGTDAAIKSGFPLVFSCQTSARGRFAAQVRDGVVGFSPARTGFVAQMHAAGRLSKPRFSLCFERPGGSASAPSAAQQGSRAGPKRDAGTVTLGGYNPSELGTPMTYAQSVAGDGVSDAAGYRVHVTGMYLREGGGPSIRPDHGAESVRLRRVSFNPEDFNAEGGGMAVDSGAPYTVLHASAEESFREMWNRSTGGREFTFGKMFLTEEELESLPVIILQFRAYEGVDTSLDPNTIPNMAGDLDPDHPHDALVAIPPAHYMERNPTSGAYRARISFESAADGPVLGSNAMQGHTILYDLQKKRVGFAESRTCESPGKKDAAAAFDDDMYAAEEETGNGGVHVVEGTLNDDDLFSVPVDSAAAPLGGPTGTSPEELAMTAPEERSPTPGSPSSPETQKPPPPAAVSGQGEIERAKDSKVEGTGSCTSVSCRVWVAVGYFFVGCLLAVVYRTAKNKSAKADEERRVEEEQRHLGHDEYHHSEGRYYDDDQQVHVQKEEWEGLPDENQYGAVVYGSEVQKDLYDLEEEEDEMEYEREILPQWR